MPQKLREYRIRFERVMPGETAIPPEFPDNIGLRSKLGGDADWEQEDETPSCVSCQEPMTFVAQLVSIEQDSKTNPHRFDALSNEQHYMFGDAGMLYIFHCFNCLETKAILQSG